MIIPKLVHPIDVQIKQLDTATTVYDDIYREENDAGLVYKTPITLKGQIAWKKREDLEMTKGGESPESVGHITFELKALKKANVKLCKGDVIIGLDEYDLNCYDIGEREYYIARLDPAGHYPGRPYLLLAYFNSRLKGKVGKGAPV